MTGPIDYVQPGDLISATTFNHVADHLNDLMQRVAALEGQIQPGTNVTLKPFLGSARILDEITVEGTNFAVPVNLNMVRMDGQVITQFNPGTDDSHLIFNVPFTSGVPRDVTFTISNSYGSASMPITILPAEVPVPVGELRVTQQQANTGPIVIGQTYTFDFTLDSQTNIPEEYILAVTYAEINGSDLSSWRANTRIANLAGQTIDRLNLIPGSPVTVHVELTVPAGAVSADMALQAISVNSPSDPQLNVKSTPVNIEVGEAPAVSDPRTSFGQFQTVPPAELVNNPITSLPEIQLPVGQPVLVRVEAEYSVGGTYTYTAQVVPDSTAWDVSIASPASGTTNETAGSAQMIIAQLTAVTADSTNSHHLEIHAARTGPSGETFDSWARIDVRNA